MSENALFGSYSATLDYCCSLWYSGLLVSLKKRQDVILRKMVRFIHSMGFTAHVGLSWLSVPDRVTYFKLVHIFCICNNLVPKYLMTNCRSISDAHTHNTSGSNFNYCVSKNLARSQNSFAYTATRSWISISVSLKSISDSDIKIFKRKLRMALLIDFFLLYDALHVYGFMSYGFGLTNLVMFFI